MEMSALKFHRFAKYHLKMLIELFHILPELITKSRYLLSIDDESICSYSPATCTFICSYSRQARSRGKGSGGNFPPNSESSTKIVQFNQAFRV